MLNIHIHTQEVHLYLQQLHQLAEAVEQLTQDQIQELIQLMIFITLTHTSLILRLHLTQQEQLYLQTHLL
jgi:hypothetical protein